MNVVLNNIYFKSECSGEQIPEPILTTAKSEFKDLLTSEEFNADKIKNTLMCKPWADIDKINYCVSIITDQLNELIFKSVLTYNCEIGDVMIDFDWALKLIFGTSNLKSLNYQIIQLNLTSADSTKLLKNILYEVKKDVLLKLINQLETMAYVD